MITPETLKQTLAADGWRFAPEPHSTGVGWYAYRNLNVPELGEVVLDCTSNEKPPQVIIKPWEMERRGDTPYRSVEFSVAGEVGGDQWVTFKVYSVSMDDAIATIPRATEILLAAWNAAAALKTPATIEG